ncbi:BspA family leucine-rich repeat surface protein, partial [Spongiivirga sp. MCCC 1A20706]|uniref:BspA family leucine-rich repeat surface protein n=1 Tax=Spongiivirga sp. MCCC 1A20706 TaxID=3160963 RepID=UPI00397731AA
MKATKIPNRWMYLLTMLLLSTAPALFSQAFVTEWSITGSTVGQRTITIPTTGTGYNYTVDWGDGTLPNAGVTGNIDHTYATTGNYIVTITGSFPRIFFNQNNTNALTLKIVRVREWGPNPWTSMANAFQGCALLSIVATDTPNLTNVTDMSFMFENATFFNSDISNWDVSNVTNMRGMFQRANRYNQPLNSWDVSSVTNMSNMFNACRDFNRDLNLWDVSNVTNMSNMFKDATSFNRNVTTWDVTNVASMREMFNGAAVFNQDIGLWNVANVTDMAALFTNTSFNQDIGSWNVSNVTDMLRMFEGTPFNQDISSWNVSSVTLTSRMFENATVFNQNIGSWDVSNVTNFNRMFSGASSFNQGIGGWNVGGSTQFRRVFENAIVFNQDIGGWNLSNAVTTEQMFDGASNFDQDLGNWDVGNVSNMNNMFRGVTLSSQNYDGLLIGWNSLPSLQNNITLDFGSSTYCAGASARANLINTYNWSITDGGQGTDSTAPSVITQNITIQLDGSGNATIQPLDVENGSTDDCQIDLNTASLDISSFTCANLGANTVTLSISDVQGNTGSATAIVTVQEDPNQPLTAIAQNITVQLDSNGQASITPQDIDNGSGSGCNSTPTLSLDITTFDCTNIGVNTVTLTATEGANTDSTTAVVTVEDSINPTVVTQDIAVQLDMNGMVSIIATDVDNGSTDNCGIATRALDVTSFDCSNIGANTVTLTITDNEGNVATGIALVTVEDNIAPTVVTRDVTIQLNSSGNASLAIVTIENGSTDNCGIAFSVSPSSFTCNDLGPNTVTLTGTDPSGNVATATAIVTIEEDPNQTLTAIAEDITVQLDVNGQATITPQDIDNGSGSGCNSSPALSLDISSFDCSNLGTPITVTLTAAEGPNTATDTALITVVDNEAPIAVVQDITLALDANGQASIMPSDIDNGSTDNCAISNINLDRTNFTCADLGTNEVVFTVTDNSGNNDIARAVVTIIDTIPPTVITQDTTIQLDASGNATIAITSIDNGSIDNCGASFAISKRNFTCADLGQNTVTLTVTDASGNSATATAVVTVEEDPNQPLTAIAQDITVQLDANGSVTITPQDVDNGSNSGCNSNPTLSLDIDTFDCSNLGTNTVTLTATQGSITSTATATVTVADSVAPVVVTQDITLTLDANNTATIT